MGNHHVFVRKKRKESSKTLLLLNGASLDQKILKDLAEVGFHMM